MAEANYCKKSLIFFPLGLRDVNPVFKVSDSLYGRNKEMELISTIIESTYNTHQIEKKKAEQARIESSNSNTTTNSTSNTTTTTTTTTNGSDAGTQADLDQAQEEKIETNITKASIALKEADSLLRVTSSTSLDHTNCEIIVLKGPGGIGKTSVVSTLNVQARQCGYTASAKFDKNQKRPYNGLLRCLSSILRQLLTESGHVVREFYTDLKESLGPQFINVRLMVSMVPELKPILYDYRERVIPPDDDALSSILNTEARFHAVFLNIIRCIARKKMITLVTIY